jgi:hypothetical protein
MSYLANFLFRGANALFCHRNSMSFEAGNSCQPSDIAVQSSAQAAENGPIRRGFCQFPAKFPASREFAADESMAKPWLNHGFRRQPDPLEEASLKNPDCLPAACSRETKRERKVSEPFREAFHRCGCG